MDRPGPSGTRSTASHRKCMPTRHEATSVEPPEEPEVEEEAVEEAQAVDEHGQPDDAADIGAGEDEAQDIGSFPGGPVDFTLLPSFRNHIAAVV
ncbi:hypothetical protein MRB53_001698 [Persea americana]|uniref:Uncharacterized protein n=1 Tax=Persea americana TaxID=3435 RepID=A0ACC2MSP9_PERAE|nr:hypothetical protein MRB53_001698 [Persea americana]